MKNDHQLQQDVLAELAWQNCLDAAGIGVAVMDRMVGLAGRVCGVARKWEALSAAQRAAGVEAFALQLVGNLAGSGARTDADIKSSALTALAWSAALKPDSIQVRVESDGVALTGAVDRQYQRQAAIDAIRDQIGAIDVSDPIASNPAGSEPVVKSDLQAALHRVVRAGARGAG